MQDLLNEIPGDDPCGPDMEYEPVFQEMERASQGRPPQEMGDSVTEGEEPQWRDVAKNAEEILKQSKDLRAAVFLTRALLNTRGLAGLDDGLAVVKGLCEQFWDDVHPKLDPDDDNDPTMRVNVMNALGDREATILACRHTPLVDARGLGAYGLWHMDIASGNASLPENFDGDPPNTATIDAAFMQCELDDLQATSAHVDSCVETLAALEATLAEKMEISQTPDFSQLSDALRAMRIAVNGGLERRGVAVEGVEGDDAGGEAGDAQPQQGISGTVQNREDVVRVIDQICEFYRRTEPSSPVPMLLQRAKRLVHMDFMEIIRDLAPSGVSEAEVLRGPEEG